MTRPGSRSGFTLTELLVVVCILVILMSILVVGSNLVYSHALQVKCQHRMEQIWTACLMYSGSNGNKLPCAWHHELQRPWYDQLTAGGYAQENLISCPSSTIEVVRGEGGYTAGASDEAYELIEKFLNWINNPSNQTAHSASGGSLWKHGANSTRPAGPAFAALSFLGSGYTINHPTYGPGLEKALKFLTWASNSYAGNISSFDTEGYSYRRSYNQGICVMALCDAYRMMGDVVIGGRSLKTCAQKAVNYLVSTQNRSNGGFPYTNHWADNSASSWAWQGIASAKAAGLLDAALQANGISQAAYDTMTSEYHWRCIESNGSGRYQAGNMGRAGGSSYERMTPATLAVRLLTGLDREDPTIAKQMNYLKNNVNIFKYADGTSFDLYITYYTSLAFFQLGGDEWDDWDDMSVEDIENRANTTANPEERYFRANNHYPAVYSQYGGHIYPTAIAVMSLQMACSSLLPGSKWYKPGSHSFGYNELLGQDLRTPAADTVVLMDYTRSSITIYDTADCIRERHGGKANVLFADGRVVPLHATDLLDPTTQKIEPRRLTPEGSD
jgi:prepilin-type processing-associated H-X9-DG protein/prepilin-type N-terminal cleavage/methylation domain-containing protein